MPAAATAVRSLPERALEVLRRAGNPFRDYFARNPDDEVCARYHVPELFAKEREQLLGVVDLYRYTPTTHSEVLPILGNKGSGKTHLLYSIKHGPELGLVGVLRRIRVRHRVRYRIPRLAERSVRCRSIVRRWKKRRYWVKSMKSVVLCRAAEFSRCPCNVPVR